MLGMGTAMVKAFCRTGEQGMETGQVKTSQNSLTEIHLFFFFSLIKCSPGCCNFLLSFQNANKVDFEREKGKKNIM